MSLIGSLEQFDLTNILRRIEVFSKTGLLVVKQGDLWVELYFRQGQLVCIGPLRANISLIDRLLQAGLLSSQSLPQVMALLGSSGSNETRIALTLIKEGYLSHEALRAWSSYETSQILHAILTWQAGNIYFEEDYPTPADRLLVALSISALLETLPASPVRPASVSAPSTNEPYTPPVPLAASVAHTSEFDTLPSGHQRQPDARPEGVVPGTLNASELFDPASLLASSSAAASNDEGHSGLLSASQLIEDLPFKASGVGEAVEDTPASAVAPASIASGIFGSELDVVAPNQVSFLPPQPVTHPLPPARLDTSFMTPELILVPVDLSSLRERNPQVQLTPDQWRLFALIDGQSSLRDLCRALMVPADQVRMVAGELIAIGLVMPLSAGMPTEFSPTAAGGVNNQVNAAPAEQYFAVQPSWSGQPTWQAPAPANVQVVMQPQWGNGQNSAAFVTGGWVLSGKHPVTQAGSTYVPASGYR